MSLLCVTYTLGEGEGSAVYLKTNNAKNISS
jgi:hypothetical protein